MKFFEKKKISKILQESRKVSAKTDKNSTTELLFACHGNYLVYHLYLYPHLKCLFGNFSNIWYSCVKPQKYIKILKILKICEKGKLCVELWKYR